MDKIKVLVYSPNQVGTVELTVLDESTGRPIPKADIYVDLQMIHLSFIEQMKTEK